MSNAPHKPTCTGHRERLRQKFNERSLNAFLPHEVLELLLTYVIPRKDADEKVLKEIDGIGAHSAQFLKLIREVFKLYSLEDVKARPSIRSPQQVMEYCKASLSDHKEEYLELIFLSIRNTVLSTKIVATGVLNQVLISTRQIVEYAIQANASRIILVHNHPSGDASPSNEDIKLTQAVVEAAALFEIRIEDHIIVGKGRCYSLRANGYI